MTANQLIHPTQYREPGAALSTSDDWPGRQRPHGCTTCRYWGGPGHTLAELLKLTRNERETTDENPIRPSRRACAYWSAAKQEHCKSTHRVRVFGTIGPRCESHDPDVLNARHRALTNPIALAV